MQTIEIKKEEALKAYKTASSEGKTLLINLIGKEIFSEKITDKVKTFEDALSIVQPSENVKTLLNYNGNDKQFLASQAHAKLSIIAAALNEGWWPDFTNDESKYYPWFKKPAVPGVGFSFGVCAYGCTVAAVGSRLCFKTAELAEYAGKQFIEIYNDFLN